MGLNTVRPAVYYIAMPRFLRRITSILPATIHRRNCEPYTKHKVSVGKWHLVIASHQDELSNTTAFDKAHDHRLVIQAVKMQLSETGSRNASGHEFWSQARWQVRIQD